MAPPKILDINDMNNIKRNENLKEENLRAFIDRNLTEINAIISQMAGEQSTATTVDEIITFYEKTEPKYKTFSSYKKLYIIVFTLSFGYQIKDSQFVNLPSYLYNRLGDKLPFGYWLLSSDGENHAFDVCSYGYMYLNSPSVTTSSGYGIRPVITITKENSEIIVE